ncbi:conserved hypothetical protein [delta proteobacterium NaphS2]|nr:conserved hypothetical protein [delta proteobacterium NaphS2]EFK10180.1 conserved hypothetical protein [delta proteobacterium NaphS2]
MSKLSGMNQITAYYGFSEPIVLTLIRTKGFPAVKLSGGMWQSDTVLIDKWRRQKILNELQENKEESHV